LTRAANRLGRRFGVRFELPASSLQEALLGGLPVDRGRNGNGDRVKYEAFAVALVEYGLRKECAIGNYDNSPRRLVNGGAGAHLCERRREDTQIDDITAHAFDFDAVAQGDMSCGRTDDRSHRAA